MDASPAFAFLRDAESLPVLEELLSDCDWAWTTSPTAEPPSLATALRATSPRIV